MKINKLLFTLAISGLGLAGLASANAATIANGDFSSATIVNTGTNGLLLSTLAVDTWHHQTEGTAANWIITGGASGVAEYDATNGTGGPRTRLLTQVIDGTGTTGIVNFTFDIQIGSIAGNNDTDMGVYLFGWNDIQTAPTVDHAQGDGFALTAIPGTGDATSLLGTSPYVIFENGVISTDAASQGVNTTAGFDSVSLSADFGTGYENIAVIFAVSFDRADSSSNLAIDNVALVPEPSTTALLGLAGLALILRRRR